MIDKLNIGQKFIITYRPMTHNGVARPKLKNGKDTRQITRRAQWNEKCLIKRDQDKDKKNNFNSYRFDREERLSLSDCEDQLKEWARELVDREIRRRPEGLKLKQLEDLKQKAIDQVMESGTPEELIKQLDQTTKKIGIAWVVDTSKIKQIEA